MFIFQKFGDLHVSENKEMIRERMDKVRMERIDAGLGKINDASYKKLGAFADRCGVTISENLVDVFKKINKEGWVKLKNIQDYSENDDISIATLFKQLAKSELRVLLTWAKESTDNVETEAKFAIGAIKLLWKSNEIGVDFRDNVKDIVLSGSEKEQYAQLEAGVLYELNKAKAAVRNITTDGLDKEALEAVQGKENSILHKVPRKQ